MRRDKQNIALQPKIKLGSGSKIEKVEPQLPDTGLQSLEQHGGQKDCIDSSDCQLFTKSSLTSPLVLSSRSELSTRSAPSTRTVPSAERRQIHSKTVLRKTKTQFLWPSKLGAGDDVTDEQDVKFFDVQKSGNSSRFDELSAPIHSNIRELTTLEVVST